MLLVYRCFARFDPVVRLRSHPSESGGESSPSHPMRTKRLRPMARPTSISSGPPGSWRGIMVLRIYEDRYMFSERRSRVTDAVCEPLCGGRILWASFRIGRFVATTPLSRVFVVHVSSPHRPDPNSDSHSTRGSGSKASISRSSSHSRSWTSWSAAASNSRSAFSGVTSVGSPNAPFGELSTAS